MEYAYILPKSARGISYVLVLHEHTHYPSHMHMHLCTHVPYPHHRCAVLYYMAFWPQVSTTVHRAYVSSTPRSTLGFGTF